MRNCRTLKQITMKKILFLIIFIGFAVNAHATACTSLNPTVTETEIGTGNYAFDLSFTAFQTYYLDEVEWDFDDGTIVTNVSQYMTHQFYYQNSTTFTVTAKCTFKDGAKTDTCYATVNVSVPDEQPGVSCPVIAFQEPTNCPSGETTFSWAICNSIDYDGDGSPDNYWTVDYVEWSFGDGSTATQVGSNQLTHTYFSSSLFSVTAIAYCTGDSSEQCVVNIVKVDDYGTPCSFVDDPSLPHTFYDTLIPTIANPSIYITSAGNDVCSGETFSVYNFGEVLPTPGSYTNWTYQLFLDGDSITSGSGIPDNTNPIYSGSLYSGDYAFEIVYTYYNVASGDSCWVSDFSLLTVDSCEVACDSCNSFKPFPGERYWVSAWVKEDHASQVLTYSDAHINLGFTGTGTSVDFYPEGDIVEGWQRVVGSFVIPTNTTNLSINLVNDNNTLDAYFDDIRIHPFNASMKSYVYDPETYWLTSELDDNNYATFYEYDKEGQLIRIKKETARGVMTIQESRSNNPKKP